jgi:hypothetical protein
MHSRRSLRSCRLDAGLVVGGLDPRFIESPEELAVIYSYEFKVVGTGTSRWRRPAAAELTVRGSSSSLDPLEWQEVPIPIGVGRPTVVGEAYFNGGVQLWRSHAA